MKTQPAFPLCVSPLMTGFLVLALRQPNCYSRIVTVDGVKHIVIFSARDMVRGEEVTYDYKFPFEEEKIPCFCGAPSCRGRMN